MESKNARPKDLTPGARTPLTRALPVLIALISCLLAGTATAQQATIARDSLVAAHYPPLMIEGDAETPGLAIEIMQVAADRLGRELALEFLPFPRAMLRMDEQPGTMMAALFRAPEREARFRWIAEIHSAKIRFMTLGAPVDSLEQARELRLIGVEKESSADRILTRHGFTNVIRLNDPRASAQMLAAGRIDAWFLTQRLSKRVWKDLDISRPLIAGEVVHEIPIYLVGGLGVPDAVAELYQTVIGEMRSDGTLDAILTKYEDLQG